VSTDKPPLTAGFDCATVELDVLQRAAYAVAGLMTMTTEQREGFYLCTLHPRHDDDLDELAHRLRSEVIDQTLRVRIARETEPVRNLVFALGRPRKIRAASSQTKCLSEARRVSECRQRAARKSSQAVPR
jgi:His-Xaa-Ser system protein HxsD